MEEIEGPDLTDQYDEISEYDDGESYPYDLQEHLNPQRQCGIMSSRLKQLVANTPERYI